MPTQNQVIKEIVDKVCTIHGMQPCLGNISNIIPVLTCCQEFKEQIHQELTQKYGEEFVEQSVYLT